MLKAAPPVPPTNLSVGIVTGSVSRLAGGLFNSVRHSALNLSEAGVDVGIYALHDEHSAADIVEWKPLAPEVFDMSGIGPLRRSPAMAQAIQESDHDVLHLHGIWQLHSRDVLGWSQKRSRPVMISPRGMLDPWALSNSAWKKWLVGHAFENRNLREAACLHALNRSEAESMRAYGLDNPVAIIPNGADLPTEVERDGSRCGRRTILFIGRIHPKKGVHELLQAWSMLDRSVADNWTLKIAGWDDGGHLGTLRQEVKKLSLGDSVQFTGPLFGQAKDDALRSADAFILPSYSEGLPMSVLEAWSYSLPVLMTRACNLPEGFDHGAAIEVETDPELMAVAIRRALSRDDLNRIGAAGRELVSERFTWCRIAEQHIAVYQWMRGAASRPDCVEIG